jgi:hypothetical protein
MTPDAGAGTSVSTLSVETSSNGSSRETVSPTDLSHRVTVASRTDSPRTGSKTSRMRNTVRLNPETPEG